MKTVRGIIVVASLLCVFTSFVWALGEEHFGNEPFSDANYTDWPGLMPIVNDPNRIYHWWVNGNERFHYRACRCQRGLWPQPKECRWIRVKSS